MKTKGILSWVGHSRTSASQLTEDSILDMRAPYCLTGKWLEQSKGAEFLQELQSFPQSYEQ
jgi:hypothetical protein